MLDKKATELTNTIFDPLDIQLTKSHVSTIQAVILNYLEAAYLQGRVDQINKVEFWKASNGLLKFRNK